MLDIEIYHDGNGCIHINQIIVDGESIAKFSEEKMVCEMKDGWTPEKLDGLTGHECRLSHYGYHTADVENKEMETIDHIGWWEQDQGYPSKGTFLGCKTDNGLWHIEYQVNNDEEETHEDITHN
jgi:hypothetical protein